MPTTAAATTLPRLNLPPLTRALFLTVLALSTLNATLRFRKWSAALASMSAASLAAKTSSYLTSPQWAIPALALVPARSLPAYPWTVFTASLVENNLLSLAVSAAVVWFCGRYLERAYGGREFARFVLFVTVIPNLLTWGLYTVWHAMVGTEEYPHPIQGLLPLEAAFLVALKQLVPEHTLSLFRATLRIRVKHLPALFTLGNLLSGPLLGTHTATWLALFGFFTAWIYLRFLRVSDLGDGSPSIDLDLESAGGGGEPGRHDDGHDNSVGRSRFQGDASDTFSFPSFFPDVTHPVLVPLSDGIYAALVRLRLCAPFAAEAVEAGNASAAARSEGLPGIMNGSVAGRGGGGGGGGGGEGGRRAEAERRRALALRALDERLAGAKKPADETSGTVEAGAAGAGAQADTGGGRAGGEGVAGG